MPSLTAVLTEQVYRSLLAMPAGETIGYDVFWERKPALGPHGFGLVLILSASNPRLGEPAITVAMDLAGAVVAQDVLDQLLAKGVAFLRGAQRAALS